MSNTETMHYVYAIGDYGGVTSQLSARKANHKSVGRNVEKMQILKAFDNYREAKNYEDNLHLNCNYAGRRSPKHGARVITEWNKSEEARDKSKQRMLTNNPMTNPDSKAKSVDALQRYREKNPGKVTANAKAVVDVITKEKYESISKAEKALCMDRRSVKFKNRIKYVE